MMTMLPPLVIDVRVRTDGARDFRVWFPFVLLWPLLFLLVGLALLVTVLVDFALLVIGAPYHRYSALLLNAGHAFAAVRGTSAHVHSATNRVRVDIY